MMYIANRKSTRLFTLILLFATFVSISLSPIQLLSFQTITAEAASYKEGVNKTVKLNSNTVRFYMSKSTANKYLKTGGTISVFIPGGGKIALGVKWLLALFGIWGSVPGGFRVDIQKDHHGRPPYYHNFQWQ